jgi:hypothetical protein
MNYPQFDNDDFNRMVNQRREDVIDRALREAGEESNAHDAAGPEHRNLSNELGVMAVHVAQLANQNPSTADKKIRFYRHARKGFLRRSMRNYGETTWEEDELGWVVVKSSGGMQESGTPSIRNKSGLGLALTESGLVSCYLQQSEIVYGLIRPVGEKIRHKVDRPTLFIPLDEPNNPRATPLVVQESFQALAEFVADEEL